MGYESFWRLEEGTQRLICISNLLAGLLLYSAILDVALNYVDDIHRI